MRLISGLLYRLLPRLTLASLLLLLALVSTLPLAGALLYSALEIRRATQAAALNSLNATLVRATDELGAGRGPALLDSCRGVKELRELVLEVEALAARTPRKQVGCWQRDVDGREVRRCPQALEASP